MTYQGARFTVVAVPWGKGGSAWAVWDNQRQRVVEVRSDEGVALELAQERNLRFTLRRKIPA